MDQKRADHDHIPAATGKSKNWKNYTERTRADGGISRFIHPTIGGKQTWIRIPDQAKYKGKKGYERFLAETLAEAAEGSTNVRFNEAAHEWLDKYDKSKPATYNCYRGLINNHLVPHFGAKSLKSITSKDFTDFCAGKMKIGLQKSYVKLIAWAFKSIYDTYVNAGLLKAHPGKTKIIYRQNEVTDEELDEHDIDQRGGRGLTTEDVSALINNVYPYYQLMVALMIWTGLRVGEALAMQWKYLDLDKQIYRVERNLNRNQQLGTPKTAASRAPVQLSNFICEELKRHRAEQAAERLRTPNWQDQDLIFASSGKKAHQPGAPRRNDTFAIALRNAAARAGINHVTPHDLRHTCATLLIQKQRCNIKEVSKHLRHASPELTQKIYGHLYPEDLPAMASAMDELFLGKKTSFL